MGWVTGLIYQSAHNGLDHWIYISVWTQWVGSLDLYISLHTMGWVTGLIYQSAPQWVRSLDLYISLHTMGWITGLIYQSVHTGLDHWIDISVCTQWVGSLD